MTTVSRAKYFAFRTLESVVVIFLIFTCLFFFFRFMPGSYTDIMTLSGMSPEAIEAFEQKWGLNDPLYVQYYDWLANLVQLDAGDSLQYRTPVWEYTKMRIFHSFILVAPGITFAYILGSVLGTVIANKRAEDYVLPPAIFLGSFPEFFTAIFLIVIFAGWLGWFPTSGMVSSELYSQYENAAWWRIYFTTDFLKHYILPFSAVVFRYLFVPLLIMRTSVSEVRRQGFFYYYRMAGISKLVRLKRLAKHSSLPVITLYPVSMTRAIGGLVLIEVVFNWPGIGHALISAVLARDFPVVQFIFAIIAVYIVFANYFVDILYGIIDPRVSIGEESS